MIRIKRPVAAAGAAVLLAFSLSACGGAPTDASEEDFCDAFNGTFESVADVTGDEISEDQFEDYQEAVEELNDVGTPEKISDDERDGFEVFVEVIGDADYDDVKDADSESIPGVDKDDEEKVAKFFAYGTTTCTSTELPEDQATDAPTE